MRVKNSSAFGPRFQRARARSKPTSMASLMNTCCSRIVRTTPRLLRSPLRARIACTACPCRASATATEATASFSSFFKIASDMGAVCWCFPSRVPDRSDDLDVT